MKVNGAGLKKIPAFRKGGVSQKVLLTTNFAEVPPQFPARLDDVS